MTSEEEERTVQATASQVAHEAMESGISPWRFTIRVSWSMWHCLPWHYRITEAPFFIGHCLWGLIISTPLQIHWRLTAGLIDQIKWIAKWLLVMAIALILLILF